jgi:hypothetical protein
MLAMKRISDCEAVNGQCEICDAFDRDCLEGTNINPVTLLATDYFNHFNNVEMVLEMLPMAPECFEEIADWQPRSYIEHFAKSGLRDAPVAMAAYRRVDPALKTVFEGIVEELNAVTLGALDKLRAALPDLGDNGAATCSEAASEMRALLNKASALVNGTGMAPESGGRGTQDAINALFGD